MPEMPTWDTLRKLLNWNAQEKGEWAGAPMPVDGIELVVEPRYPGADKLNGFCFRDGASPELPTDPNKSQVRVRNSWYSVQHTAMVYACDDGEGTKAFHVMLPEWGGKRIRYWFNSLGVVNAWSIEAEERAMDSLRGMVSEKAWKCYFTTGSFLETSKRSGMTYFFRRLRPTIAIRGCSDGMKILACLCMHPIGYYKETWCGVHVPTDDVISHLLMMRCDEHRFWSKANHHPLWAASSGV